jgi:lysophospholipase L1-like esterase
MRPIEQATTRVNHRRRVWLFRLAAIALGLIPFLLLEAVFALLGWGRPDYHVDPFVGFRGSRPLFELNADEGRYEISSVRRVFFRPESFSAVKSANEIRIFCLGGSTVQGRPYAVETSFTTWLELSLQAADPDHVWQVVNCGGISYASYRLAPLLKEVLTYQPDLIILYTGHNEFLEERSYEAIKKRPPAVTAALKFASNSRTFNLLQAAYQRAWGHPPAQHDRPLLAEDVQALLDYQGGLEKYRPDPVWRAGVVEHFHYNLRRMVELSQEANVPIWLVDPVCNLRDSPPFKAAHRSDLPPEQLRRWNELREQASRCFASDLPRAVGFLKQAARIDDQHAGLQYDLAKSYEAQGDFGAARQAYRRARDLDVCPLRIIQPLQDALQQVAQDTRTPLIPVRELFERNCRQGIPGGYLLVDHVHPSISGHQMIAELMIQQMAGQRLVSLSPDWKQHRDALYQQHLDSLDDKYYMQGQRRLQGLRTWAQGRATLLPGTSPNDPPRPVE